MTLSSVSIEWPAEADRWSAPQRFAWGVVRSPDLAVKLAPGNFGDDAVPDDESPPAELPMVPGRPEELRIVRRGKLKVPPAEGMGDVSQRRRLLHALANHELQAAELFAWAYLRYSDAPREFRAGLLRVLDDEQRHTRMYIARLEAIGGRFGEHPVTGYFWNKAKELETPAHFVCAMSLTFENANLDHTIEYAEAAVRAGDSKTAAIIDKVHLDEIQHVRFGWEWLGRFKRDDESMWQAYERHLVWPLQPSRGVGRRYHESGREAVGMSEDFLAELRRAVEERERGERKYF